MRTPGDRLDAFEKKHGEWNEILDRYCTALCAYDQNIQRERDPHFNCTWSAEHRSKIFQDLQRARSVVNQFNQLIAACMGYSQAMKDAENSVEAYRCGQRVQAMIAFGGVWLDGAIVRVSHDNTDGGAIPFSQVTVRFDAQYLDRTYSGPEIKMQVRRAP